MAYGIPDARRAPAARYFNGQTLDYDVDPNGRIARSDPVPAAAFYLLRTPQKSVRSATHLGETVSKIRYEERPEKMLQMVTDRVLTAWSRLISTNRLRVNNIQLDLSVPGALLYEADFTDLTTGVRYQTPKTPFFEQPDAVSGAWVDESAVPWRDENNVIWTES